MSFVDARRERAVRAWNLQDEVVLVAAGKPIGKPGGADQTFPYSPHPQYRWLTDRRREGGVLAYDPQEGWTLFEPPVTEMELVWGPDEPAIGRPIEELKDWISAREGRKIATLGSPQDVSGDEAFTKEMGIQLDHARRPKDETEIALLHRSAAATAAGYERLAEVLRPGVTERQLQIEFEAAIAHAGADGPGYATIVGTGPNSAVFHFTPGNRKVESGDLVLVDAGAQVEGYVTDVTRTYSADGKFTADQQWLYDAVLRAETRCIEACTLGTEWLEIHRLAATTLAEALREADILKCSPEEAVEGEVMALFFPHGVGHLVGLGVRDAAGPVPGRERFAQVGGIKIRIDLPLLEGYVVTVEPGMYFIPALLNDPARRTKFEAQVNWPAVERFIGKGGVRIEDNILITPQGPVNLTAAIPK